MGSQIAQAQAKPRTKVTVTVHATGSKVTMGSSMDMGGAKTGYVHAVFTINAFAGTICYKFITVGIRNIEEAHIHEGARGVDGTDVVSFDPATFNRKSVTCISAPGTLMEQGELLGKLVATPANYYFNVHTTAYPEGAVRGQL